jgi:hypothetical protein
LIAGAFFVWGRFAMATPKIQIAPELIAKGKRLYETTMTTIADIAGFMGIKRRTLENRIVEWNWKRRRQPSGALEIFHAVRGAAIAVATAEPPVANGPKPEPVSEQQRLAIAQRIMSVVEREMDAAERIVNVIKPNDQIEAEHGARTLASVSRTLREIKALTEPDQVTPPDETDDDPVPRDIDEFRYELARRIRGFIEARRASAGRVSDESKASLE